MRKSWSIIGCAAAAVASTLIGPPALAAQREASVSPPQLITLSIPAPANEIPSKWLSYPGPPRADVLLPAGYNTEARYPLLVLLNGLGNNYASYQQDGVVAMLGGLGAIVVMPEGASGWYTDWWNGGTRGSPSWETYELDTVLPTILARFPILPQRRYHAIAGFSMGGLGAVYLGGRLPGFFGSVASLSGFVDLGYGTFVTQAGMGVTALAPLKGDDNLYPVDGSTNGFYFLGHNPAMLAANLAQSRVFESTGTGVPSAAGLANLNEGTAGPIAAGSLLESTIIYPMNEAYHHALVSAGVNVTYQVHAGGHDIPDFYNELSAVLAWGLFKPVVTDPMSWVNDTVATSGQLWGFGYRFAQPPTQVVQFRQSGSTLFVSAAGSAVTITTSGGCVVSTPTPATIPLRAQRCD